MSKSKTTEEENRREISGLKDVLAQLNTTVAILTEATKGLKEVIDRELSRHSKDLEALSNRASVTEVRIDNIDIALAKNSSVNERLLRMDERLSSIEVCTNAMTSRLDIRDGWSAGMKWAIGITLAICVPSTGYLIVSLLNKVFGMGVH
jgi:hypothetical protein